jgi:outer membrane protein assembly factor BamD (BamD/ComL family)
MYRIRTTALLLLALAVPCLAAMDSSPMYQPPPDAAPQTLKVKKADAKRGLRWYRKPDFPSATDQMKHARTLADGGRLRKAANAYQALVYAWPDSTLAPQAQWALAEIMEQRGKYERAFQEYQYLVDYYPGQFDYPAVLDRQFKLATLLMTDRKARFLFFPGFQAPERALPLFEQIVRNAPSWDRSAKAQLNVGIIHELNEEPEDAIAAYEVFQYRFPLSADAPEAAFRGAKCLHEVFRQRPNDENACNAARAALVHFISAYPEDHRVAEARGHLNALNAHQAGLAFQRATYYDTIARRPAAAIIAYEEFLRNYPSSANAETAQARLAALRKVVATHEKK